MTTAQILEAAAAINSEYAEYAAEARACGYETLPIDEWSGARDLKAEKMAEWQARYDNDTIDLY